MGEQSPGFFLYVKDWYSSMNVRLMGATGRGIHMDMMVQCWLEGCVPDDPAQIARLVGESVKTVNKCWDRVRKCYRKHPSIDGMLINERIEEERGKQEKYRARKSQAGQKGAEVRWQTHGSAIGSANGLPMASDGGSFALSSSTTREKEPIEPSIINKRRSVLDIPDIAQALLGDMKQKVDEFEEQKWSDSMRFLHNLFPPTKIGTGASPPVRVWTGRIPETELNRAIKEIQNGEYPGKNGNRVTWRDLDDDARRRVVLAVLNPMANERS